MIAGTTVYLCGLPHNLGASDEGAYLYESKMLLQGRVLYRDVFEIVAPGFYYLTAALFWLFGSTMATARTATAVLHGFIVAGIYGTCRLVGVRRTVAVPFALVYPAFIQPGIAAGLIIAVQQHKGAVFTGGVVLLLLVDGWLTGDRTFVFSRLVRFVLGVALVAVPVTIILLATTGPAPAIQALVMQPLTNYRTFNRTIWGSVAFADIQVLPSAYVRLFRDLPLITAIAVATLLVDRRRPGVPRIRNVLTLSGLSAMAMLSIANYPDFIHIAFIAPLFLILLSELIEWLLGRAPTLMSRLASPAVCLAVLFTVLIQLRANWAEAWQRFPVAVDTPFGRIDLGQVEAAAVMQLRERLGEGRVSEFFIYPGYPALYLVTGVRNATPYQLILPGYSPAEQLDDAISILDRRRVPFVLLVSVLTRAGDPVVTSVTRAYDQVADFDTSARLLLYQRRGDAAAGLDP
ncbi:MAG: hypothetical protein E6J56_24005 [Deltaproteobacteria bacterium]|nr:MAG: hypothetical protein E6J56_24005 [Deltaproteobacteria bacterium]